MSGFYESLITAQANGPALTAAASASCIPTHAKITLKPGFFERPGQKLIIEAAGVITSLITTPGTARYDVRFGASVVFDGLAILLDTVAAHTNVAWKLRIELRCIGVGPAATMFGIGQWTCEDILGVPAGAPKGVLTAMLPWNAAPVVGATFDSTLAQVLDMNFTQTAATGSMQMQQYEVVSCNAGVSNN